jgi:hypothetical protein
MSVEASRLGVDYVSVENGQGGQWGQPLVTLDKGPYRISDAVSIVSAGQKETEQKRSDGAFYAPMDGNRFRELCLRIDPTKIDKNPEGLLCSELGYITLMTEACRTQASVRGI